MTSTASGPLAPYRVLELGSTVAGPFCGRLLGDFGAEVIKVEPPTGDPVRSMGKHVDDVSLYAASIFRNKRLLSVDLRQPEGREVIRRLVPHCDLVIENFRPGGLEKWELGYEDLKALRPDIVMVRISGFGQTGPYSPRPGFGVIGEAVSGLRHLTGDPDRPPARVATSLTDYITGLYAAFAATMALLERERSGRGQMIDATLFESAFSFTEPHVPAYATLGHVANRAGARLPGHAPNNLYPTKEGRHVHIAATSQPLFRRLARAIGREDLTEDERFATAIARGRNIDALDGIVGDWTRQYTVEELEKRLFEEHDVPVTRIFTMADIFRDVHYRARDMLVEMAHEELGSVTVPGVTPKLSETPGSIRRTGGRIGRDTDDVLRDVARMDEEEIARLRTAGAVA